ncbi:hypothetical protein Psi02_38220 [Planotetraspora silvatica]|uniref:Uncharacterized protein n=1 Tax=Planotetraspora silvatica TaxID=234614 RepID=A0A8J3UKB6_9ACTN|nr:hypothetical protein Psi02_38220 [Planotetraspora silvatica]
MDERQVHDEMSRHRAGNSFAGMTVGVRLLALTTAAVTLSGFVAAPQANASARAASAPSFADKPGPIRNHNSGRHNQNAPAINSPNTVRGVQQVNSVSGTTITQNGQCRGRRCTISQRLRSSHGGWRSRHGRAGRR